MVSKTPFTPGIGIPLAALLSPPRVALMTNFVICQGEGCAEGNGTGDVPVGLGVTRAGVGEAIHGTINEAPSPPRGESFAESRFPAKDGTFGTRIGAIDSEAEGFFDDS
jgi:hypothetical protein